MPAHRGFSAWIVMGDRPLPEYAVSIDEDRHIIQCWIPCEEGRTFEVFWRDLNGEYCTSSYITLDGTVTVPGRFTQGQECTSRAGIRTGPTSERPFRFEKVDSVGHGTSVAQGAGTISLRIKRVRRTGTHRPQSPMVSLPGTSTSVPVPGDIRVGFGDDIQTSQRHPYTFAFEPMDGGHAYVTFVFRYRSREFLLAQGIMTEPRPPKDAGRRIVSAPVTVPPENMTSYQEQTGNESERLFQNLGMSHALNEARTQLRAASHGPQRTRERKKYMTGPWGVMPAPTQLVVPLYPSQGPHSAGPSTSAGPSHPVPTRTVSMPPPSGFPQASSSAHPMNSTTRRATGDYRRGGDDEVYSQGWL